VERATHKRSPALAPVEPTSVVHLQLPAVSSDQPVGMGRRVATFLAPALEDWLSNLFRCCCGVYMQSWMYRGTEELEQPSTDPFLQYTLLSSLVCQYEAV